MLGRAACFRKEDSNPSEFVIYLKACEQSRSVADSAIGAGGSNYSRVRSAVVVAMSTALYVTVRLISGHNDPAWNGCF